MTKTPPSIEEFGANQKKCLHQTSVAICVAN